MNKRSKKDNRFKVNAKLNEIKYSVTFLASKHFQCVFLPSTFCPIGLMSYDLLSYSQFVH